MISVATPAIQEVLSVQSTYEREVVEREVVSAAAHASTGCVAVPVSLTCLGSGSIPVFPRAMIYYIRSITFGMRT